MTFKLISVPKDFLAQSWADLFDGTEFELNWTGMAMPALSANSSADLGDAEGEVDPVLLALWAAQVDEMLARNPGFWDGIAGDGAAPMSEAASTRPQEAPPQSLRQKKTQITEIRHEVQPRSGPYSAIRSGLGSQRMRAHIALGLIRPTTIKNFQRLWHVMGQMIGQVLQSALIKISIWRFTGCPRVCESDGAIILIRGWTLAR